MRQGGTRECEASRVVRISKANWDERGDWNDDWVEDSEEVGSLSLAWPRTWRLGRSLGTMRPWTRHLVSGWHSFTGTSFCRTVSDNRVGQFRDHGDGGLSYMSWLERYK